MDEPDTTANHADAGDEPPPRDRIAALRPVRRLLLGFFAVLGLAAVGIGVLDSPIGHRWVAQRIAALEPENGLRIHIGRIEGSLFGDMVVHDLVLSDPGGRFASVPETDLDWRPLAWLTSGLDIRLVVMRRGYLRRLPQLRPGDPDAPILPGFDIRIDHFELERLRLGEELLGEERVVDFLARTDIRSGRAVVDAMGELGGSDRLSLALDARPDEDIFDVDLDYFAPQGGVLARLAGTRGDIQAIVTGEGSWSEWNGALLVRQDGARLAALKLGNRGGNYSALGQLAPDGYAAGLVGNALGKVVALSLEGTLADNVLDSKVALAGRALRVNGGGRIDLGHSRFDAFGIKARTTDPDLLGPEVRLEELRLTAELDGPFGELRARHLLELDRLVSGDMAIDRLAQRGTLTWGEDGLRLPLGVSVRRITSGVDMVDPRLVNGTLEGLLRFDGDRLQADQLRIVFRGLAARLALSGDLARGLYGLSGPVGVQDFRVADVGSLSGRATIDASIGGPAGWRLRASIDGTMPEVTNGTLANIAGEDIRFRGRVDLGQGRPILFNQAELEASKLALALDGTIAGGTTTLAGSGRHEEYGPFTIDAQIAGDGPRARLVLADPLPAAGLKDVQLAIAPITDGFAVATAGQSTLGTFDGDLRFFALADEPTRIEVDRLDIYQTEVTGRILLAGGGLDGGLSFAGGGIDGEITLEPQAAGQGFTVAMAARNAEFGGETPLAIARGELSAAGVLASGRTDIEGRLDAQGLRYGALFLGQALVEANVAAGRGEFTANLAGRRGTATRLTLKGDVTPARSSLTAAGLYGGMRISMPRRAVLVRRENEGWILRPSQLRIGEGNLLAEGRFGGEQPASGRLQFDQVPLALGDAVLGDLGLGGAVSGIFRFAADDAGLPTGDARLLVKRFSRSGLTLTSRPIDLALVARLDGPQMQARAVLDEDSGRSGRFQLRISDMPAFGGLLDRLYAGRLLAQLRYNGPADALWRLSTVEAFDVTGTLEVNANAMGSLARPRLQGSLSGDGMRLQSGLTGTDVADLSLRGRFNGARLELTRLSGKAANGGEVTGSGTVDLSGLGQGLPVTDLRLAARGALLMDRSDMRATVTGPLRIVTNRRFGTIAGKLRIESAYWRLGFADAAEQLPNIRTREVNLPPDIAPADLAGRPWRYLIDAAADDNVRVEGLGLDSEWRASVRLRGTTDDPRIGGEANLVEGDYRFAGTEFEMRRGRILFDESGPIDPQLDILAETETTGLTANVSVTGTAMQPEIRLGSIPALPEEEILARLLYGGSITTLSATDALQLGAALASLRGGGGLDPINQLRDAVGLDRLRIVAPDPALDRGTSVALGKKITDRFYGEIITDGQDYNATELEFRVTGWLSLLASISSVGRQSVGIQYRRDY